MSSSRHEECMRLGSISTITTTIQASITSSMMSSRSGDLMQSIDLTAHSRMMTTSSLVTTVLNSSRMSSSATVTNTSGVKFEETTADVRQAYAISSKIFSATSNIKDDTTTGSPQKVSSVGNPTAAELSADFRMTVGDGASSKHVITKGKGSFLLHFYITVFKRILNCQGLI